MNLHHERGHYPATADDLLREGLNLSIVATSRALLGIRGEHAYAVSGLAVDEPADGGSEPAATRLFIKRAGLSEACASENAATIRAICRRLDGSALAIELIAAWARTISLPALHARLDTALNRAVTEGNNPPSRQQALSAVIDLCFELLEPPARLVLTRLAVLGGRFTLDNAIALAGFAPLQPDQIAAEISILLARGMLFVSSPAEPEDAERHYHLLRTIHDQAREKLASGPDHHIMRDRLIAHLIAHYTAAAESWAATPMDDWLARYGPALDNLRAALAAAFISGHDAPAGLVLMSLTGPLWRDLGLNLEQRRWLREAQRRFDDDTTPRSIVARLETDIAYAWAGGAFGDRRKLENATNALALFRAIGNPQDIAEAACRVAICIATAEDPITIQPYRDMIAAALPAIGRGRRRAWSLNILAVLLHFQGETGQAVVYLEEARSISREFRDPLGIQIAGLNLAEIRFAHNEVASAAAEVAMVADSCRASGNLLDLAFSLSKLAAYALILDDCGLARVTLREATPLIADIGIDLLMAACVQSAALLVCRAGDPATAQKLAAQVDEFYRMNASGREPAELAIHERLTDCFAAAEAGGTLPADLRAKLTDEGSELSSQQAIELALASL